MTEREQQEADEALARFIDTCTNAAPRITEEDVYVVLVEEVRCGNCVLFTNKCGVA